MKFRCERETLAEALASARRAAASRTAGLQILSGLHLELEGDRLTVTATDRDLWIQVELTVDGQADGAVLVPAALAADVVRSLPAASVTFDATGDDVQVSAGRTQFGLRTFALDDYPRLPVVTSDPVRLPSAIFAEALRQVTRAASNDDAMRRVLTGVRMEPGEGGGLRLVATDSYRLAVRDLAGADLLTGDHKVIVPSRALTELVRLLDKGEEVAIRVGEQQARFEVGGVRLTTVLIEGEFPNYRQLIPAAYPNRLVVGREALLDAVRRMRLVAEDPKATKNIRLGLQADGVELSAMSPDLGATASEHLEAKYEGTEFTVAFNPDFLIQGLEAVVGDEVVLETNDAMKPAIVKGTDAASDYLYLLMPVRVTS